jgi:hypothetical protein
LARAALHRTDAELVRQTFGVDSPDQLDCDVDISIGSARDDGRRKIVPLHHSHRIAPPAQSDANVRLRTEANFVGVYSNQQPDVRRSVLRAADAERRTVSSRTRRGIPRRRIGKSRPDVRTNAAVVRQNRRASWTVVGRNALSATERRNGANAQRPAHKPSVRF